MPFDTTVTLAPDTGWPCGFQTVPLTIPPRTVAVMLARGNPPTSADTVTLPPTSPVIVACFVVSPAANWSCGVTCATVASDERRSMVSPPAGAGIESCTVTGTVSPAASSKDSGSVTVTPERTVNVNVAGALTLPKISLAVADRLSIAPSAAPAGTRIWNGNWMLFDTGDTCFA